MKKYILVLIALVSLYSCDERGILENSNDVSYIYFTKNATNDSTSTSFFFYPEGDISVPVAMSLSGKMFDEDCSFKLEVVKEETTLDAANYDISGDFVFHKDRVADTIILRSRIVRFYLQRYDVSCLELLIVKNMLKEILPSVRQLYQFQILLLDRNGGMKMNG